MILEFLSYIISSANNFAPLYFNSTLPTALITPPFSISKLFASINASLSPSPNCAAEISNGIIINANANRLRIDKIIFINFFLQEKNLHTEVFQYRLCYICYMFRLSLQNSVIYSKLNLGNYIKY